MNFTKESINIDVVALQKMQDSIANATGLSLVIVKDNNMMTSVSNQPELISDIINSSERAEGIIDGYTMDAIKNSVRLNRYTTCACSNGLVKIAVPIIVNGEIYCTAVGGDIFDSKNDEATLASAATELGLDKNAYIAAANKVNIIDNIQIDLYCEMISDMFTAYFNACKSGTAEDTSNYDGSNNREISSIIFALTQNMSRGNEASAQINQVIGQLKDLTKQSEEYIIASKDIVKSIQNIALNTRILGFNASIEAARAKESGKGFGVIAQEVRSLADVSATSTEQIETNIQKIEDCSKEIATLITSASKGFTSTDEGKKTMREMLEKLKTLVTE